LFFAHAPSASVFYHALMCLFDHAAQDQSFNPIFQAHTFEIQFHSRPLSTHLPQLRNLELLKNPAPPPPH